MWILVQQIHVNCFHFQVMPPLKKFYDTYDYMHNDPLPSLVKIDYNMVSSSCSCYFYRNSKLRSRPIKNVRHEALTSEVHPRSFSDKEPDLLPEFGTIEYLASTPGILFK